MKANVWEFDSLGMISLLCLADDSYVTNDIRL